MWHQDRLLGVASITLCGLWIQDQASLGFGIGVPKPTICLKVLKGWVGTKAGWAGQCWMSAWEVETYVWLAGDPEGNQLLCLT